MSRPNDAFAAWQLTCERLQLPAAPALRAFDELRSRYAQPRRRYHTMEHVLSVLAAVRDPAVGLSGTDLVVAELAAWLHDAVYDPRSSGNEAASAALAMAVLGELGVASDVIARVAALIEATADHRLPVNEPAAAAFLDADLMVLASPPRTYAAYAAGIRREYAWVTDDVYRTERVRVLRAFLDRERLFRHPAHAGCERLARTNIAGEIARLQGRGVDR